MKSDRKSQEPYDFTHMQAIKLKATNEQKHKQKLVDDSMMVPRGKEGEGIVKGEGGQTMVTGADLTLGVGTQCKMQMMLHRIVHLKPT